jgi:hypothetical protein
MDQHVGFSERKNMMGKNNETINAEARKADILDWLLAIDASVP